MHVTRLSGLLIVLLLAGCGGGAADVAEETEAVDVAAEAEGAVEEAAEAVEELPTEVEEVTEAVEEAVEEAAEAAAAADFPLDATYEENGLSLQLQHITFYTAEEIITAMGDDAEMYADMFEAPVYVKIDMAAENATDQDVDWFPGQGTLQIGSQQVEPDLFISEEAGGTMLAGTKGTGANVYPFDGPVETLVAEEQARFVAGAPFSAEEFEELAPEVDLTLEWTP